jgi:hypothetical protein
MNTVAKAPRDHVITAKFGSMDPVQHLCRAAMEVCEKAAKTKTEAARLGADVSRWRRESGTRLTATR